jgi:UTP--glucose-1-phosphate uridylyltransferase
LCAQPFVGDRPFVVALGDSIIGLNATSDIVRRMTHTFVEENAAAVIAFEPVPSSEVHNYGIAKPRGEPGDIFLVEDVVEKPDVGQAPSNLAIAARYVFAPEIFAAIQRTAPGKGGEIQLTDAIRILLQDGRRVFGIRLDDQERRYDIGNIDSYFRAFVEFALADDKHGPALRQFVEQLIHADH